MKDLSSLAKNSMWPTSQAGGNMTSSNEQAMTAPGSEPVDPMPPAKDQGDPTVEVGTAVPPGTDGKPKARNQHWSSPGPPSWGKTTAPDVTRKG